MVEHSGKFVAYYRVSTKKQGADGLGIAAQETAVAQYLNGGDWKLIDNFVETESGKDHKNRPKLEAALHLCRITGATLVVARLDRLSRDVEFLAKMQKASVPFVCADNPHVTPLTVHILAAVAQDERERISRNIKKALAEIKSGRRAMRTKPSSRVNGWIKTKLGPSPEGVAAIQAKPGSALGVAKRRELSEAFALDMLPVIEDLRATGITSQVGIATALNSRGIRARQGKASGWSQPVVGKLLARLATIKPTLTRG